MTAKLQRGLAVAQCAKLMNVSERGVYKAARILRDRPDLEALIMAGKMSLDAAYRLCVGPKKPPVVPALQRAWNTASKAEREEFMTWLAGMP